MQHAVAALSAFHGLVGTRSLLSWRSAAYAARGHTGVSAFHGLFSTRSLLSRRSTAYAARGHTGVSAFPGLFSTRSSTLNFCCLFPKNSFSLGLPHHSLPSAKRRERSFYKGKTDLCVVCRYGCSRCAGLDCVSLPNIELLSLGSICLVVPLHLRTYCCSTPFPYPLSVMWFLSD